MWNKWNFSPLTSFLIYPDCFFYIISKCFHYFFFNILSMVMFYNFIVFFFLSNSHPSLIKNCVVKIIICNPCTFFLSSANIIHIFVISLMFFLLCSFFFYGPVFWCLKQFLYFYYCYFFFVFIWNLIKYIVKIVLGNKERKKDCLKTVNCIMCY